VKKISGAYLM